MNMNRILVRINRISAWSLLIFITIYMISGYAWTNHILMPVHQAMYLHTVLDIYMMPFFLAHVLIEMKFTLKRRGIQGMPVNLALISVGLISYVLVLMVR